MIDRQDFLGLLGKKRKLLGGYNQASKNAATLVCTKGTESVGTVLLDEKSACRSVVAIVYLKVDFAELYSAEGQLRLSSVILAIRNSLQFIEKLPDRQAPESLRMRLENESAPAELKDLPPA